MKKAPHKAGPKARNKSSEQQYTRSLAVLQISPGVVEIPVENLHLRPMRPEERSLVRSIWWRQWRLGHRMPAERDVIVIPGGRP